MDEIPNPSTNDPRIKRVLKRYLKNEEFSGASMDLTGISFRELQAMCSCSADGFTMPRELDGLSLVYFTNGLGISFDASKYDYFIHSYTRREFCSPDRLKPKDIHYPCEDGPPTKIPLPEGYHWVSSRPDKDGLEQWIAVENNARPKDL